MSNLSQIKVSAFYVAVFNRAPDHQGLNYWLNQIQGLGEGATYSALASQFAQHPVFAETYGSLTDVGFVESLYTNILGQAGDSNGVAYWVNKLSGSVGMTRVQVLTQFVQDALTVDLTVGAAAWGLTQEEWEVAVARQNYLFNKAEVGVEFASRLVADSNMSPSTVTTTLAGLMADPAYVASIDILKGVTNESSTLVRAKDLIQQAVSQADPLAYISANASDAPTGPIYYLTEGADQFPAGFGGDNGGNDHIYGSNDPQTFNTSDVIDGGYGYDTLTLDLVAQTARVNSGFVADVERLDINAFEGDGSVTLQMTRFDDQLEQINIRGAQDDVNLLDQQSIAAVRLVDTNKNLSLDYDSQLVLGVADHLSLAIDEVVSTITVGAGIESVAVDIEDGRNESSTLSLVASTVDEIVVEGGLNDQRATLNIELGSIGGSLDATAFAGDLTVTSADLAIVETGAGDDIVTVSGWQDNSWAVADLGNGNNVLNITANAAGSVIVGTGTDDVNITGDFNGTAVLGSSSAEVGSNTMDVSGVLRGAITGTSGVDTVAVVGATTSTGVVNLRDGVNAFTSGQAFSGTYTGGINDDVVTITTGGLTSTGVVNLGSASSEVGSNTLTVGAAAAIAGAVNGSSGADTVTATGSTVSGSVDLRNGTNILGAASITGTYTGGTGNDTVTLTGTVDGTGALAGAVSLGAGTNALSAANLTQATVTGLGGVDTITVTGVVSGGSVNTGSGNDVISIGTDSSSSATVTGDAEIRADDGSDTVTIKGDVAGGALIDMGASGDTLNLTGSATNMPTVSGSTLLTEINMGSGADTLVVTGSNTVSSTALIQSGASVSAGSTETGDVLTVQSVDDVTLIQRTAAQSLTINFAKTDSSNYAVGDVVSVTVAGVTKTYTVREVDVVQGNGSATSNNVAAGLLTAINGGTAIDGFSLVGSVFTYLAPTPGGVVDADKVITAAVNSTAITPTVVQIANTSISGFETLNLTALNAISTTDGEGNTADINVNIALTSGITNINLANQDDLVAVTTGAGTSAYVTNSAGDANVFSLTNLNGNEIVTITANEASATGNYQVNTVTIVSADATHKIGDVVSVTIGDVTVAITVTEAELTPGASGASDANLIATKLAAAINAADVPLDAFVANNVVTLKGVAGAETVSVSAEHARPATFVVNNGTLSHEDGFDIGTKVLVLDRDQGVGDTEDIRYNIDNTLVAGYNTSDAEELPYAVGDIIRVTVGAVTKQYVVTQEALDAYCERGDTSLIAEGIAAVLSAGPNPIDAVAVRGSVAVVSDDDFTWTQIRGIDATINASLAASVQNSSVIDDQTIDTTILATLPSGDTGVDTFQLTVNGNEDYDIALGSMDANFVAGSKYESLNLSLGGTGDYYINTYGQGGNYNTAITISGGVAGQNVELDNVLAETITSTSAANLTIDRQDLGDSDRLVVTTGAGSDHLITSMGGLLAGGASVNLGTGSNTLSIYSGSEGSTIGESVLAQVDNIAYTGNLDRLEIRNEVDLTGDATLAMMGTAGQVDSIYFSDFSDDANGYDLTISGTASTLSIESADDFELEILTTSGVSNLTVVADEEVNFVIGSVYADLNVTSLGSDADIHFEDLTGSATRTFGQVRLSAEDDANVWIDELANDTLNISDISVIGGAGDGNDADLEIEDINNATITIGDVSLEGWDPDLYLDESVQNSNVTIGNVIISGQSSDNDTAGIYVDTLDSTISIQGIEIKASVDAEVKLDSNNNVNLTVGDVSITAGSSDADFTVNSNITSTPTDDDTNDSGSEITVGDVTVVSCESDAVVEINYNNDGTNEADLRITLGDVTLDAEDDVYLEIYDNANSTIVVGDVTASAGTFESLSDAGIYINIESNTVTEASESNRITVGNITAVAYGSDAQTDLEVSSNFNLDLGLGNVQLSAFGDDADARFDISDATGDTVITIGQENNGEDPIADVVVLTATDDVSFDISDNAPDLGGYENDSTYIDIHGNVELKAGRDAQFVVQYNGENDVSSDADYFSLDIHGNVTVEAGNQTLDDSTSGNAEFLVIGNENYELSARDVTITSTDNSGFKISDNENGMMMFSDVTVETLTANSLDADLLIDGNSGMLLGMLDIHVESESTDGSSGYANLSVRDNANALMILGEDVFGEDEEPEVSVVANAGKAEILIDDNDDILISMGEDFFGEDDSAEILVDSAQSDASIIITDNGSDTQGSNYLGQRLDPVSDDDYDLFEDYTVTTNIYLGDVEINAGQDASLIIDNNNGDDADVFIRVGDVEMNADDQVRVYIEAETPDNNDATQIANVNDVTIREATDQDIIVGDFNITALGMNDDAGPTVDFEAISAFYTTDDWEANRPVPNSAVYFADWDLADNSNPDYPGGNTVTLGDVTINSGGSDSWVEVDLTNIYGTETIDISADHLGASDSMIELDAYYTHDLNTVILSGDDSNVYLAGFMGGISDDNGSFLLDMSGMTGAFSGSASAYNPDSQDDGNYIETHGAEFDGTVNVLLGSGDFIYNAAYTGMWGSDSDWSGNSGWYSLGQGFDWEPEPEVVTLSGFDRYFGNTGNDSVDTDFVNVHFNQGNQSYLIVLSTIGRDFDDFSNDDDVDTLDNSTWDIYFRQSGAWVNVDTLTPGNGDDLDTQELALLAGLLGVKDVAINQVGYAGVEVVITGHDDGTSFTQIEELVVSKDESGGMAGSGADLTPDEGYFFPVIITSEAGELALDAIGQESREVFTFTGDYIGEIVIGGFNPGSFNTFSPENGRETDRLDFSQFDWNSDGVVDSSDQFDLSDFNFTIDDGDGFFKDVIVDFNDRDDLGQIRLVGVGEYADAIELVQDSIYFG